MGALDTIERRRAIKRGRVDIARRDGQAAYVSAPPRLRQSFINAHGGLEAARKALREGRA